MGWGLNGEEGPGSGLTGELWRGGDGTIGRSGLAGKDSQWEGSGERKGLFSFLISRI